MGLHVLGRRCQRLLDLWLAPKIVDSPGWRSGHDGSLLLHARLDDVAREHSNDLRGVVDDEKVLRKNPDYRSQKSEIGALFFFTEAHEELWLRGRKGASLRVYQNRKPEADCSASGVKCFLLSAQKPLCKAVVPA